MQCKLQKGAGQCNELLGLECNALLCRGVSYLEHKTTEDLGMQVVASQEIHSRMQWQDRFLML
eukprot:5190601-Amphidinium_carterae.1